MSKCLRCGAGSEWIQGRVPKEPPDDSGVDYEIVKLAACIIRDKISASGDAAHEARLGALEALGRLQDALRHNTRISDG